MLIRFDRMYERDRHTHTHTHTYSMTAAPRLQSIARQKKHFYTRSSDCKLLVPNPPDCLDGLQTVFVISYAHRFCLFLPITS